MYQQQQKITLYRWSLRWYPEYEMVYHRLPRTMSAFTCGIPCWMFYIVCLPTSFEIKRSIQAYNNTAWFGLQWMPPIDEGSPLTSTCRPTLFLKIQHRFLQWRPPLTFTCTVPFYWKYNPDFCDGCGMYSNVYTLFITQFQAILH